MIKFRGKKVAIEKNKKQKKGADNFGGLIMPDSEEYVGIIKYVGEEADPTLKVGQKVYFSTDHQAMRIGGLELCVMEDKSVLAVIDEELSEQKA